MSFTAVLQYRDPAAGEGAEGEGEGEGEETKTCLDTQWSRVASRTHARTQRKHKHETRLPGWRCHKGLTPPTSDVGFPMFFLCSVVFVIFSIGFLCLVRPHTTLVFRDKHVQTNENLKIVIIWTSQSELLNFNCSVWFSAKNNFQKQLSLKLCIMPWTMTSNINFWPRCTKNFDFGCFIAQNMAMENIRKIINWHFTGQEIVKFVFWCHNQLHHTRKWGYRAQNYDSIW